MTSGEAFPDGAAAHAFRLLYEGDLSQVDLILDHLKQDARREIGKELKQRMHEHLAAMSRIEQRRQVMLWTQVVFRNAAYEVLLLTLRKELHSLKELNETFLNFIRYWLFWLVVRDGKV